MKMPFNLKNSSVRKLPMRGASCEAAFPSLHMTGVVKKCCPSQLEVGGVHPCAGTWIVHTSEGDKSVRCAASCLLLPQLNDIVHLSLIEGQWWTTAVLVAASRERAVLQVQGVQELAVEAPALVFRAQLTCHVDSPVLEFDTRRLEIRAHTARLSVSILQLVARSLTMMAQCVNSFSDQLNGSCRVRNVQVDEVDSLVVRHAVTKAETSSMQAGQVLVNARDTVKIDGARIMMG